MSKQRYFITFLITGILAFFLIGFASAANVNTNFQVGVNSSSHQEIGPQNNLNSQVRMNSNAHIRANLSNHPRLISVRLTHENGSLIIRNNVTSENLRKGVHIARVKIKGNISLIIKYNSNSSVFNENNSVGNNNSREVLIYTKDRGEVRIPVKILPAQAAEIARLRAFGKMGENMSSNETNRMGQNVNLTLEENNQTNPQVESKFNYKANVDTNGKVFGLFRVRYNTNVNINGQTGEVISVKKPWWTFVVF